jgi:hypothetical protein
LDRILRKTYVDVDPVGNADIAVTLADVLHLELPKNGQLTGRRIDEALVEGRSNTPVERGVKESEPNSAGIKTCLSYQKVGATWYFDSAGFPGRTAELPAREK